MLALDRSVAAEALEEDEVGEAVEVVAGMEGGGGNR